MQEHRRRLCLTKLIPIRLVGEETQRLRIGVQQSRDLGNSRGWIADKLMAELYCQFSEASRQLQLLRSDAQNNPGIKETPGLH